MEGMKSKVKMKMQSRRKDSPVMQETLKEGLKLGGWRKIVSLLCGPTKKLRSMNLDQIDEKTKAGDRVVVVGKVLARGELTKKIRICALNVSEKAKARISESKSEIVSILEEMKKNPKADGIKIL